MDEAGTSMVVVSFRPGGNMTATESRQWAGVFMKMDTLNPASPVAAHKYYHPLDRNGL